MKNHRKILVFSVVFLLLATVYLIPPKVNYLYWSLRFKALARSFFGFIDFLTFVILSFHGGETPFYKFVLLTLSGPIIGLVLIRVWKQDRDFLGKEKVITAILFNCGFGLFAVYGGAVLVSEPFSICEETLNENTLSKVIIYPEVGWEPGSHYFFVSSTDQGDNWEQVFWLHHRDPNDVSCQNLQKISDETYWFWLGWEFAVTHDGGQTWHTWTPGEIWPEWMNTNYDFILNVQFENQLDGIMEINPPSDLTQAKELVTHDGGHHWTVP